MKKTSAVYCIRNLVTNERYIGSSRNVEQRWRAHRCKYEWKKQPNNQLYLDMQKYGLENFRFTLVCPVEPEHLKQVEQEVIEMFKPEYNRIPAQKVQYESNPDYVCKTKDMKRYRKEWYARMCFYEGLHYTLRQLETKFVRDGIPHPTKEACKYLIQQENEEK